VYGNAGDEGAYEALNAVVAYEDVPKSEPVIPPVTVREPVIIAEPKTSSFALGIDFPIPTFPEPEIVLKL